jgi:Fe-Mn family superoxide dismutase
MTFQLPKLPYAKNALEPYVSRETLDFHYGKHHAMYIAKLNMLIKGTQFEGKTMEEIVATAPEGPIFNNAGEAWNHAFYWNCLTPNGGGEPYGPIKDAIDQSFGSFAAFKEQFIVTTLAQFGSSWVWLVKGKDGKLKVHATKDAGTPIRDGAGQPLLAVDLWEHAYYVDYRNSLAGLLNALFNNLVNWDFANKGLETNWQFSMSTFGVDVSSLLVSGKENVEKMMSKAAEGVGVRNVGGPEELLAGELVLQEKIRGKSAGEVLGGGVRKPAMLLQRQM